MTTVPLAKIRVSPIAVVKEAAVRGAQACGVLFLGCLLVPVGAVILAGYTLYSNRWIEEWNDNPMTPHCGT